MWSKYKLMISQKPKWRQAEPTIEKAKPIHMESWKPQLQTTEEVIQMLQQGLGSFHKVVVEDCLQQMAEWRKSGMV